MILAETWKSRRVRLGSTWDWCGSGQPIGLTAVKSNRAQYLIRKIKSDINCIHSEESERQNRTENTAPQPSISMTWVAGHMGSEGNEAADALAKEAAEFGSSECHLLPKFLQRRLPTSLSATIQHSKKSTKLENIKRWRRSKRFKRINTIDPELPSQSYIKATEGLNHRQTSVLTQLRTGHIALNKYLHRIQRSETPNCPHCPGIKEDTDHMLLRCWKYAVHRHKLVVMFKHDAYSAKHLLSDRKAIPHTLNFLNKTGRFRNTYGDIKAELIVDDK